MPIIVGIDGTGAGSTYDSPARNAEYDRDFANSFVRTICFGKPNGKYIRGPIGPGGGLPEAIQEGLSFIVAKRLQLPGEPILLTGYSRGALGVINIAKELKDRSINVRALMMFDCVDRHVAFDGDVIPNNVENVCHVTRNPAARSRMTFGNDGMSSIPPTNYLPIRQFICTHGGMGGTPWQVPPGGSPTDWVDEGSAEAWLSPDRHEPVWTYHTNVTYAQDAAVSRQVWEHVQGFLSQHGFI
jgi:hypothetical protein